MSTLKLNSVQIGQSTTPTNNFTLYQPLTPDGTLRIGNGNVNSTVDLGVFTNSGNFGIGTSTPTSKLHIVNTNGAQSGIGISQSNQTFLGFYSRALDASSSAYRGLYYDARNENDATVANLLCDVNIDGSSAWSFSTQSAGSRIDRRQQRLTITGNGNVLLNSTTTPMAGSKMLIKNDASNLSALALWNATGGTNTYVDLTASTYSSHTTSWPATIRFTDDGSFSNHISFRTKNSGNAANVDAERMKILSSGQVQFPFQPCCEVSRNLGGETFASNTNYGVGATFGVNRGGFYSGGGIGGGGVVLHVPVSGYYKITLNVYAQEGVAGKRLNVMTSAGTGAAMIHFIAGTFTYSSTGVVNMTAGQYLYLANSSYGTLSCYTALAHTYITVEYLG